MKSRPKRVQTEEGKITGSPSHAFMQNLFGKQFTSTKAGEPSDESELQGRTEGSWSSVKQGPRCLCPFLH